LLKEKKTLEERLNDMVSHLGDEEEKAKQLTKIKTKYEAIIADLEERLKKEQEVDSCTLPWSFSYSICDQLFVL